MWKHVKHDKIGKTTPRSPRHHFQRARDALAWLAAAPEVVRSFFRDPHLDYLNAEPSPV